jgi:hypothetical protein
MAQELKSLRLEIKDTMTRQTAAIEGIMDQYDMSSAASTGNRDLFKFTNMPRDPPMVPRDDPRVHSLVQALRQFRLLGKDRRLLHTTNEKQCRDTCIIPFFKVVAEVYGVSTAEPNSAEHQLKVFIGKKWFHGYTDLFVGGEKALINKMDELILMIEMKPMTGGCSLNGTGFENEKPAYQAQIALQAAAIQSCCLGLTPFTCILTNLRHLYVLEVTSYNSIQITAQTFKCVSDESKFVRAVLKAADTNKQIQKQYDTNRKSIMCVTGLGYDSSLSSLALGGIRHVQTSTQGTGTMGAASHEAGNLDDIDGFEVVEANEDLNIAYGFSTLDYDSISSTDFDNRNSGTAEESCTRSSENCYQPDEQSKTHTEVWLQKLKQQALADCSSNLNISKGTRSNLP